MIGRVALLAGGAAAVALLAGLGLWQLERRAWKHALVARIAARADAAPAPAPKPADWPAVSAARDAYQRVEIEGQFLYDRETLVRATTVLGSGYWVMTPLRTDNGTILVNRGFVPPEPRAPATRPEADGGRVRVTGLLRISEPGGGFLRANVPAAERWYSRDVAAIAARRGLADAAPFFVDEDATGSGPVGGLTMLRFPDNHLAYALTWFGLAALAGGGTIAALRGHPAGAA